MTNKAMATYLNMLQFTWPFNVYHSVIKEQHPILAADYENCSPPDLFELSWFI